MTTNRETRSEKSLGDPVLLTYHNPGILPKVTNE